MNDLIIDASDALVVPSCKGNSHVFDMRRILTAEARLVELSGLTKAKAGELLHTFINAHKDARAHLAVLRGEFIRSKQRLKEIRAIIVLDEAPEKLKECGLTSSRSPGGSEDLRDAVVNSTKKYQEAVDHLAMIEAVVADMEGRVETLRMAYFSANKLIDGFDGRRETSGGTGYNDVGEFTDEERVSEFIEKHSVVDNNSYSNSGFGAPKL
jgi:hypothetical protein